MTSRSTLLVWVAIGVCLSSGGSAQDYALQRDRCGLDPTRRLPPGPEAIEGCTAVINLGRETPRTVAQALVNRGDALRRDRNIDRAIDDYDQAIRLQPDFALAWANRGFTYLFEKHNQDQAIADFSAAIRLDPAFANVFYFRGTAYLDKGEYNPAIADFDQAIRLRPNFSVAYRDRGQAKHAKGDKAGGDADISEAERIGRQGLDCAGCIR